MYRLYDKLTTKTNKNGKDVDTQKIIHFVGIMNGTGRTRIHKNNSLCGYERKIIHFVGIMNGKIKVSQASSEVFLKLNFSYFFIDIYYTI